MEVGVDISENEEGEETVLTVGRDANEEVEGECNRLLMEGEKEGEVARRGRGRVQGQKRHKNSSDGMVFDVSK